MFFHTRRTTQILHSRKDERNRRTEKRKKKLAKKRQIFGVRDCYLDLIVDVANRDLLPVSTTCRDHRWTWGATGIATMVRLMSARALFANRFGIFFFIFTVFFFVIAVNVSRGMLIFLALDEPTEIFETTRIGRAWT